MTNIIIANIVLAISALINVITMQLKERKKILIGMILANVVALICYAILGQGVVIFVCMIAIAQTYIKYDYDKRNEDVPAIVQITLIIVSIIGGVLRFHTWFDILPIFSLICYTLAVLQNKESKFRLFTLGKAGGWLIYDTYAKAYVGSVFYLCILISTIVAIIRYDIMKTKKEEVKN